MIAELGHLLLILATALMAAAAPMLWQTAASPSRRQLGQRFAMSAVGLLLGSYLLLTYCFVSDDFSVAYVADNSNSQLPWPYKVAAVWGGHPGSLLLWLLLAVMLLPLFRYSKMTALKRQGLTTLCSLCSGFGAVILLAANPFTRLLPAVPPEGRDLNPILQDIGLLMHPPILFCGYALLCGCFACAISILLRGDSVACWQRLRQLSLCAWLCLSGGNILGAWWAYSELGWGGWWFWDPVENAAFIPWLLSTALLHCLLPKQPSPLLLRLGLLLVLLCFGSSLLGTFLVRSGIVQSLHAFTSDSTRGLPLLLLLMLSLLPALWLYGQRAPQLLLATLPLSHTSQKTEPWRLLLGLMALLTAAFAVLLGTLYPLLYQLAGAGTLSVGAPYFNLIFVPLLWLMACMMGLSFIPAPRRWLLLPWLLFSAGWTMLYPGEAPAFTWLGIAAVTALVLAEIQLWWRPPQHRPSAAARLAHIAVALAILGGTCSSQYHTDALLRMSQDQGRTLHGSLGDYSFVFRQTATVEARAFYGVEANIELYRGAQLLGSLRPQRQTFRSNGMEITQAAVYRFWWQDCYVSLGQELEPGVYLVRISIKPLISLLWLAGLLLLPAVVLALPKRQRSLPACQGATVYE